MARKFLSLLRFFFSLFQTCSWKKRKIVSVLIGFDSIWLSFVLFDSVLAQNRLILGLDFVQFWLSFDSISTQWVSFGSQVLSQFALNFGSFFIIFFYEIRLFQTCSWKKKFWPCAKKMASWSPDICESRCDIWSVTFSNSQALKSKEKRNKGMLICHILLGFFWGNNDKPSFRCMIFVSILL